LIGLDGIHAWGDNITMTWSDRKDAWDQEMMVLKPPPYKLPLIIVRGGEWWGWVKGNNISCCNSRLLR